VLHLPIDQVLLKAYVEAYVSSVSNIFIFMDVAEVDQNVACVAMAIHVCC
jgi:hypothetical protein